jgi:hypothetical protein
MALFKSQFVRINHTNKYEWIFDNSNLSIDIILCQALKYDCLFQDELQKQKYHKKNKKRRQYYKEEQIIAKLFAVHVIMDNIDLIIQSRQTRYYSDDETTIDSD